MHIYFRQRNNVSSVLEIKVDMSKVDGKIVDFMEVWNLR